jgi:uncharacterized protein YkwD
MGFNWIDLVIIAIVVYFVIDGWEKGLMVQLANVFAFLGSLWLAVRYHAIVGGFFIQKFGLRESWTNVLGYVTVAFVSELVLDQLLLLLINRIPKKIADSKLNQVLGSVLSIVMAFIAISFFLLVVLAFPVRGTIKQDIKDSAMAPFLVTLSEKYGGQVTSSLHDIAQEATKFLTVEPGSGEQVNLGLPKLSKDLPADPQGEQDMIALVNKERLAVGLPALRVDQSIIPVARAKSLDMFVNNYFSHTDLEGRTIADRMTTANVAFDVVGENLAYAPDTQTAHTGLMNSPGHRANILEPRFGRIGIGIIDGGIYGKMYTQVFAD